MYGENLGDVMSTLSVEGGAVHAAWPLMYALCVYESSHVGLFLTQEVLATTGLKSIEVIKTNKTFNMVCGSIADPATDANKEMSER